MPAGLRWTHLGRREWSGDTAASVIFAANLARLSVLRKREHEVAERQLAEAYRPGQVDGIEPERDDRSSFVPSPRLVRPFDVKHVFLPLTRRSVERNGDAVVLVEAERSFVPEVELRKHGPMGAAPQVETYELDRLRVERLVREDQERVVAMRGELSRSEVAPVERELLADLRLLAREPELENRGGAVPR